MIAGIGRTAPAMARNRDLPHWLAAVHPRHTAMFAIGLAGRKFALSRRPSPA